MLIYICLHIMRSINNTINLFTDNFNITNADHKVIEKAALKNEDREASIKVSISKEGRESYRNSLQ